MQTASAVSF